MGLTGVTAVALASGRQGVAIMVGAIALVVLASHHQAFFLIFIPAAATALLFGAEEIYTILLREQVPGSVKTLTGRTVFWEAAWDKFLEQPLAGYGFGSSRFSVLQGIGADQYTHLHNGYLEALIGVGLIGFIPFLIAVFVAIKWSIRSLVRGEEVWLAVIMPAMMLQNLIGQGFGGWLSTNLMLFAFIVAYADLQLTTPSGDIAFEIDVSRYRKSRKRRSPTPANPRSPRVGLPI
jgi:O-antigen ligase